MATPCNDGACNLPAVGQPVQTRVGPVLVITSSPCVVTTKLWGIGFMVPCAFQVKNTSKRPVLIGAVLDSGAPMAPSTPAGAAGGETTAVASTAKKSGGWMAAFPTSLTGRTLTSTMYGPARLDPGQTFSLPAPPAGDSWVVTDIDPERIARVGLVVGVVGAAAVGFAAYGIVSAGRGVAKRLR